jgi:hypothetical protein
MSSIRARYGATDTRALAAMAAANTSEPEQRGVPVVP